MAYRYPYDEEEKTYQHPKLRTDRRLWKIIVFGILTLGIYNFFFMTQVANDVNTILSSRHRTPLMPYIIVLILGSATFSIVLDIWMYQLTDRVEDALRMRKLRYDFETGDFWVWFFFGALFLVGPFIYYHKLCRAMNILCADYNERPVIEEVA